MNRIMAKQEQPPVDPEILSGVKFHARGQRSEIRFLTPFAMTFHSRGFWDATPGWSGIGLGQKDPAEPAEVGPSGPEREPQGEPEQNGAHEVKIDREIIVVEA